MPNLVLSLLAVPALATPAPLPVPTSAAVRPALTAQTGTHRADQPRPIPQVTPPGRQESMYTFTPHQSLTPKLELVRDVALLAGLQRRGRLNLSEGQRTELERRLGDFRTQPTLPLGKSAALRQDLQAVLTPEQKALLNAARQEAEQHAARRLSQARFAVGEDHSPTVNRTLWRYALSIQGGSSLVQQLKADPDLNPYLTLPHRINLLRLLPMR